MSSENLLTFEILADWVDGKLSPPMAERVAAQLPLADEEIQATVTWLRRFARASREIRQSPPPASLRAALRAEFAAFARGRERPSLFRRVVASLTFDSWTQVGLAGARSASSQGRQRQMIFVTEDAEIALNVQPSTDGLLSLSGQIFSATDNENPPFSVQLLQGTDEVALTNTDDLGEFSVTSLSAGAYEMVVSGQTFEAIISPIALTS